MLLMSKKLIYYIYSQKSFEDVERWIKDLRENSSPDIKIFLIGNKCDLEDERIISKEKAEILKNNYEFDYFLETSAKTGFNAKELFIQAAKLLFDDYIKYNLNNNNNKNQGEKLKSGDDDNKKDKKNDGCCGGKNK